MEREIKIHHHLGELEECVNVDPEFNEAFLELANRIVSEDPTFTRFAWTYGATLALVTDANDPERERWAWVIKRGLETWSIGFESDNLATH